MRILSFSTITKKVGVLQFLFCLVCAEKHYDFFVQVPEKREKHARFRQGFRDKQQIHRVRPDKEPKKRERKKKNTANGGLDFNRHKTKQNIIALTLAREGSDY